MADVSHLALMVGQEGKQNADPASDDSQSVLIVGQDGRQNATHSSDVSRPRRFKTQRGPPAVGVALAYRINDAAAVTGLSRSKLYELIAEGRLRSIKVAGRRLIPRDALEALLSEGAWSTKESY
jgi:excisionase family DNA binding protein